MADAREQTVTGHAATQPGPEVRGADVTGRGEVRSVEANRGQGPPPVHGHPPRPAARGGASVVLSAALALLFGGAGAWAYERFVPRPSAVGSTAAPKSQDQAPADSQEVAGLKDRIKDLSDQCNNLSDQYRQLQSRVEAIPKSAPAPDLGSIEQKVAQVDRLSREMEAIGRKVDPLSQKLEEYDHRLGQLDDKLEDLRKQEATARVRTPRDRDRQVALAGTDRTPPPGGFDRTPPGEAGESKPAPPEEKGESVEPALGSGEGQFREGKYSDAYATFRKLLQSQPDDARVWYYAAISYGLATQDWGPTTESMAVEGVAREKAGKPAKPEIDSAFSGLTRETGKDWLTFYRRRAQ